MELEESKVACMFAHIFKLEVLTYVAEKPL